MSLKNYFTIFLVSILLFVSGNVLGANPYFPDEVSSYSRNPSGFLVKNPVSFSVVLDHYPTPLCDGLNYWNIAVQGFESYLADEFLPNIASTTLTLEKEISLPIEEYEAVELWCYESTSTDPGYETPGILEYDDGLAIFEVVENYYLEVPTEFATNTLAYAGDLFTDLSVPIILIIGLPLGFWVINKIISLALKRNF